MQLMSQQQRSSGLGSSHARRLSIAPPRTGCARQTVAHALRRGRPDFKPDPTGRLRLYLDSANVTQWELWSSTGLLYGFTTNPTILEKDGVKCNLKSITSLARMGFELGAQEIHLQTWGDSVQRMSSTAFDLAGINVKGVVVKLPCTLEGVQTAALLRESNIRVCITGIYTAHQVLVAQAVGSEYAAPYLGRMNDVYGNNQGMQQVLSMQASISALNSRMRLLVASVREPSELSALSAAGCDTFTISPIVAGKLFNVAYTIDAASDFEAAARRNGGQEDHKQAQAAVEALSSMDGRPRQATS